jgi:flagellar biosynthetic protein FliQ
MSEAMVLGVVRQAIETAVIISLPMLAIGLLVGVAVSILQTVTSIQDNILSFIPRAALRYAFPELTGLWLFDRCTCRPVDVLGGWYEFIQFQ